MNLLTEDTIAAIATAYGTAGIGKIRISGPQALVVASKLFHGFKEKKQLSESKTYTAHYGYVIEPETDKKVDEVIAIVMRKPHSFTGEDVVEFDCHGGMVPLRKVLELVLRYGARLAEPGEFSKRAFLNNRIDLAQAESIIDVINAKTRKSLDLALNHLTGKLSQVIAEIKEEVIKLLAHLEVAIDFPEDEVEGFDSSQLEIRINNIKEDISKLLATSEQGKIYQEGLKVVIVGKPNVGKSSLLNYLLEENRAIVTDIPGTTRDIIEEYINIAGIPIKIIDTAGIRETEDMIEQMGVERSRNSLKTADLVLFVLDAEQGLTKEDLRIYSLLKDIPLLVIINKIDIGEKIGEKLVEESFKKRALRISIQENQGLEELKQALVQEVITEDIDNDGDIFISKVRQENALKKSLEAMERVQESFNNNLAYDFLTIDLKDCLFELGKITGETVTEDILDRIFADFCLGK